LQGSPEGEEEGKSIFRHYCAKVVVDDITREFFRGGEEFDI
jgi:hypothetical protein